MIVVNKFKIWLRQRETYIYINDENDEIVSEHSNGEILFGFLGSIIALIIIAILYGCIK